MKKYLPWFLLVFIVLAVSLVFGYYYNKNTRIKVNPNTQKTTQESSSNENNSSQAFVIENQDQDIKQIDVSVDQAFDIVRRRENLDQPITPFIGKVYEYNSENLTLTLSQGMVSEPAVQIQLSTSSFEMYLYQNGQFQNISLVQATNFFEEGTEIYWLGIEENNNYLFIVPN